MTTCPHVIPNYTIIIWSSSTSPTTLPALGSLYFSSISRFDFAYGLLDASHRNLLFKQFLIICLYFLFAFNDSQRGYAFRNNNNPTPGQKRQFYNCIFSCLCIRLYYMSAGDKLSVAVGRQPGRIVRERVKV